MRFTEYHELDMTGKLIWNFRNISHFLRSISGGKGSQKRILTVLLKSGRVTQTALTEYLGIQPGSASEVLSKMEAVGLIVRQENEADRRTVDVELTESGREEAVLAARERKRGHEELLSGLSHEEREALLVLLEKLAAHCKESGPGCHGGRGRREVVGGNRVEEAGREAGAGSHVEEAVRKPDGMSHGGGGA